MQIDMTDEERDILIRWKKRSDTYKLVRMRAEAILYAARGVGLDINCGDGRAGRGDGT